MILIESNYEHPPAERLKRKLKANAKTDTLLQKASSGTITIGAKIGRGNCSDAISIQASGSGSSSSSAENALKISKTLECRNSPAKDSLVSQALIPTVI